MRFHGGVHTDDDRVNAKVEASLNLRFAESGTKKTMPHTTSVIYSRIHMSKPYHIKLQQYNNLAHT